MGQNKILQGLITESKSLIESGRARVATKFACRVNSFIANKFKVYFVDSIDDATGKKVSSTVLPDYDASGNPICPDGAREEHTTMVVLDILDDEGKSTGDSVRGFIIESNVRGLPEGVNPVGLRAYATGVEAMRKNGARANTEGYFVSGLDFDPNNPAIMSVIAARNGGAMFSKFAY